jgi:DNA-binding NarL/FixJ family response regulator
VLPEHRFESSEGVEPPDLVIADVARLDPDDVAENYPEVPILGFTNHTDTAGLRRAHAAGFDQVVAKSALFERTRELIDSLLASVE